MDVKRPLPQSEFTTDVAPLPSAPPPTYDDACATASNVYPAVPFPQQSIPLMADNQIQTSPAPGNAGNVPYPVQQIQITPAAMAATGGAHRPLPVGRHPLKTTCPGCNHFISTNIRMKNRFSATVWCVLMFFTCVCIPCSCCPYLCCKDPMRVEHFCPRCNAFLGTYVDHS